jgi:hypothetical protein
MCVPQQGAAIFTQTGPLSGLPTSKDHHDSCAPSPQHSCASGRISCVLQHCRLEDPLTMSSDSDTHEVLAHRDWYLFVRTLITPTTAAFRNIRSLNSFPQLTAGNISLLFTTSGMSSGDVNAIGGQYGYVTIGPHFEFPPTRGPGLNLSIR